MSLSLLSELSTDGNILKSEIVFGESLFVPATSREFSEMVEPFWILKEGMLATASCRPTASGALADSKVPTLPLLTRKLLAEVSP